MKIKARSAKTHSYERTEVKRNKPQKNQKEGKRVRLFKSILYEVFSTMALRIRTAKEYKDGDLVI
jgi:hypothetical protein